MEGVAGSIPAPPTISRPCCGGDAATRPKIETAHIPSAFLRTSHSCQNCGQCNPSGRFPDAFSAFHSAEHPCRRAIYACRPGEPVFAAPAGGGAMGLSAAGGGGGGKGSGGGRGHP